MATMCKLKYTVCLNFCWKMLIFDFYFPCFHHYRILNHIFVITLLFPSFFFFDKCILKIGGHHNCNNNATMCPQKSQTKIIFTLYFDIQFNIPVSLFEVIEHIFRSVFIVFELSCSFHHITRSNSIHFIMFDFIFLDMNTTVLMKGLHIRSRVFVLNITLKIIISFAHVFPISHLKP